MVEIETVPDQQPPAVQEEGESNDAASEDGWQKLMGDDLIMKVQTHTLHIFDSLQTCETHTYFFSLDH